MHYQNHAESKLSLRKQMEVGTYLGQRSKNLKENGKYTVFKSMEMQSTRESPIPPRNSIQYKVVPKK